MRLSWSKVLVIIIVVFAASHARAAYAQSPSPPPSLAATPTPTPAPESQPLNYGLVIDNTGSFRTVLDDVIAAAQTIVAGNGARDEAFLIRFVDSDNIQLVHDFTGNRNALNRALESLYVQGGQTAITDALYVAAEHLLAQRPSGASSANARRALVLITDGEDRANAYTPDKVIALLRDEKIKVYVLGLPMMVSRERGKKAYEKALDYFNTLARQTGGRVFIADKPSNLNARAAELLKALHAR